MNLITEETNSQKMTEMKIWKELVYTILTVACLFIPFFSSGQFELREQEHNPVPAPPTTTALGEYSFSPVDLSTGQLGLSIPIYTIAGQSLSLPITFSYRAGVKIKETSPYTGHGWSMLAGGVITRTVNGEVDPTTRLSNSIAESLIDNSDNENPLLNPVLQNEWTDEEALDVFEGHLDAAPDVFNYNFMGYSGQFALEDDFVTPYYLKKQRDWLLTVDFTGDITIVTEDGTKYIFSEKETTTVTNEVSPYFDEGIVVSWHLTEIISATHDERIELSYYTETYGQQVKKNNTLVLRPLTETFYIEEQYGNDDKYLSYESKKLDEIVLKRGGVIVNEVEFDASTTRNDIGSGNLNALSRISVFKDPQGTQPMKYFDIDIDNVGDERLFLRSIQEFSGDGTSSRPPYLFEYINENSLPGRLEYKEDHWGYFSQQTGTQFPYSDKVKWKPSLSKEPTSTAEYGSLRKVTFPTGGYNTFYYENNQYLKGSDGGGSAGEEWLNVTKELKLNWRGDEWFNYFDHVASNSETYDFSLTEDQFVKLDMNLTLVKGPNRDDTNGVLQNQEISGYRISIEDTDANQEVFSAYFDYDPGSDDGIALHVNADSWVEFKNSAQLEYDDPNDVPSSEFADYLDYHEGSVLNSFYVSSASLAAYDYYDEFLKSEYDGSDITVGDALDRYLYLDLEAGNYQAIITTNATVDNDMINMSSEVSLAVSFETTDSSLANEDDLVVESDVKLGGGIRVKSQVIGSAGDENILTYDYVLHDENGQPTSKSSGQISEEPLIIEYTPAASFVPGLYRDDLPGLELSKPISLGSSALWAVVGGGYPLNPPHRTNFQSYIRIRTPQFSIKSEPDRIHNSWVVYSEVKVTEGEEHANTGFTLHKYDRLIIDRHPTFLDIFSVEDPVGTFGFAIFTGPDFEPLATKITKSWPYNGLPETNPNYSKPKSTLVYKSNGVLQNPTLVREEKYEYYDFVKSRLFTTSVQAADHVVFTGTSYLDRKYSLLKSKETIKYDTDGTNPVSTKISYEYNNPNHLMATKIITTNSDGDEIIKKSKYAQDYSSATSAGTGSSITMNTLKSKNIYAPIEEQIWRGSDSKGYHKLINGRLSIYDEISSPGATDKRYQPIEILKLEVGPIENYNVTLPDFNTHSNFNETNWVSGNPYYDYERSASLMYYENGNLKEVLRKDGVSVLFIWGYNDQYPIARIENFSASQITTTEQNLIDVAIAGSNNDDSQNDENILRIQLSNLRNTPALTNAMVTTYTYDPLVGVTSVTDPNGNVTYYEYNKLQQLKQTKDNEDKVLSNYQYYYQNQGQGQ